MGDETEGKHRGFQMYLSHQMVNSQVLITYTVCMLKMFCLEIKGSKMIIPQTTLMILVIKERKPQSLNLRNYCVR